MLTKKVFRTVQPYISAIAVIATAAILIFTIYFTQLNLQWVTFLTGVLVAAILAEATRASRAEFIIMRRTAQLSSIKEKLEREIRLRKKAEETIAANKPRLHLVDEELPTMVAFIDTDGHYRYHNRAFRDWLRLRPEQIDGRHMREVLGAKVYAEIASAVRQSLGGQPAHYDRTQIMPNGAIYRMSVEHVPQFAEDGKVTGFYILAADVTEHADILRSTEPKPPAPGRSSHGIATPVGTADQEMFINSFSEQITGQKDEVSRIMAAIEKNEFRLFCQRIAPLAVGSGEADHYEILIRLMEEEENMMPPGAFFPLAEKYGLMPHLDRWVVQHVAQWASVTRHAGSIFFINMAGATISDPEFPGFLLSQLQKYNVSGATLCFEIPHPEYVLNSDGIAEFARQVKQYDCCIALSCFGRDRVSFELTRGLQVDFLKIDGNIILNILRNPVDLAKVSAINKVAKTIGIKTVAELVESEETIVKLRELGVDFAQGFEISRPRPLGEIG